MDLWSQAISNNQNARLTGKSQTGGKATVGIYGTNAIASDMQVHNGLLRSYSNRFQLFGMNPIHLYSSCGNPFREMDAAASEFIKSCALLLESEVCIQST